MHACSSCGTPCSQSVCNSCKKAARYNKNLLDCPNPFGGDNNQETDTSLSTDYSGAKLVYKGERHTDELLGSQLGELINLGDLRNVDTDSNTDAMCSELIFHRYGNCGKGCRSMEDRWTRFSLDDDGAKTDGLAYVRGVNVYGCPQYLDVPTNKNQFWYAGWRLDGDHRMFGYYQAAQRDQLPKDKDGNFLVGSYDPETKEPIVAPLPLNCILGNLVSNLGMDVTATFEKVQEYAYIDGYMDSVGDFIVKWRDEYYNHTQHVGDGYVYGQIRWRSEFDPATGNMLYKITSVYYDRVDYETDKGAPSTAEPIYLELYGVNPKTKEQVLLIPHREFNPNQKWSLDIQKDIVLDSPLEFTVRPGEKQGPYPFLNIFVDWESTFDDRGNMYLYLENKITGWTTC